MHLCNKFYSIWLLYASCLFLKSITHVSTNDRKTFSRESDKFKFDHLVVDKHRDWVFIGAANRLYQLDSNLKVVTNLTTSSKNDHKWRKSAADKSTDNHNKLLVLDYTNSQLISCGSVSSDLCEIYRIKENPSKQLKTLSDLIIANSEIASMIAFTAPGLKQKCVSRKWLVWCSEYVTMPVLYVGIQYINQKHQSKAPEIAMINLDDNDGLKYIAHKSLGNANQKKKINYIHGFSSGSHSYFLTTEINVDQPSENVSKLIRIRLKDENYDSSEYISIECNDKEVKYNLAQAAFVGRAGSQLVNSLNINQEDDVLFGIFAQSEHLQPVNDNSNKLSHKSALCIYSLSKINQMFTKKSPVSVQTSATFDAQVTAVTATPSHNSFTVIFLGTNTGNLLQIVVKNTSSWCEYNNITIDEGFPINSDLHFDPNTDDLYVMTELQLTKIKIPFPTPSISTFKSTLGLVGERINITIQGEHLGCKFEDIEGIVVAGIPCIPDPHLYKPFKEIVCAINFTSKGQTNYENSIEIQVNGFHVKSKQNFKVFNPEIRSIFPKEGSVHGGTKFIISGKNFNAGKFTNVSIGDISCLVFYSVESEIKCVTGPSPIITEGNVTVKFDENIYRTNHIFKYINDTNRDENGYNIIPKGIPAGGIRISIHDNIGLHFQTIHEMIFQVKYNGQTYNSTKCKYKNSILMSCLSPGIPEIDNNLLDVENPKVFNYTLLITRNDTNATSSINVNSSKFLLYPNPIFDYFNITELNGNLCFTIHGQNIDSACQKMDFTVLVGNNNCTIILLTRSDLICQLTKSTELYSASDNATEQEDSYENITVCIARRLYQIVPKARNNLKRFDILKVTVCLCILGCIITALTFIHFCHRGKFVKSSKQMQKRMNRLELCVAAECKEAFAELQTEMFNSASDNCTNNLPFLDYRTFVMRNAFPNTDDHFIALSAEAIPLHNDEPLQLLSQLVHNKTFLLIFIRTLESLENFSMNDRIYVASLIMITLQNKMEYCTDILETLLADLIKKYTQGKTHPKLLLRRTESMVEKMLSIWFTFLLYQFLTESAGEPLFKLFKAIKQQINKGPVDMITYEARYSLNEEKLIRQCIDFHPITVYVDVSQEDAPAIGLESHVEMKPVTVLDCDTISQVKEKILDTLCHNIGFSERPKASTFNLKSLTSPTSKYSILLDNDFSSKTEKGWKRKNTLLHYGVQDGGKLGLVQIKNMQRQTSFDSYAEKPYLGNKFKLLLPSSFDSRSSLIRRNGNVDHNLKEWHLVKPCISDGNSEGENKYDKMVSEIYLTRLLATKGTLQHFVDDLFKVILHQAPQSDCFPMAIKYMFDFLDYQAFLHGVTDPEVVHTWKSNCLPLRFWVNLIKNPNFLFDVHKSEIVDSCLSVVAQAFMDSFSTSDHRLGKNSPTSKLLYAKDIPLYKQWVNKYYSDIKAMPVISHDGMREMLVKESLLHAADFNINGAVCKLYGYMVKYKKELMTALKKNESSGKCVLAQQLDEACKMIAIDSNP